MANNITNRGLTDKEMLQLCIELEKSRSRSINDLILETTHVELRDIYQQFLECANDHHHNLLEFMEKKQWQKTELATVDQILLTKEMMRTNLHPNN